MSLLKKLQVLLRLRKPAENLLKEVAKVKDGYKTTEFWMTIVSQLLAVVGALSNVIDAKTAAVVVTVLNAVYAVLRTLAKTPEPVKG